MNHMNHMNHMSDMELMTQDERQASVFLIFRMQVFQAFSAYKRDAGEMPSNLARLELFARYPNNIQSCYEKPFATVLTIPCVRINLLILRGTPHPRKEVHTSPRRKSPLHLPHCQEES